jgi:hypothetical protein
LFTVGTGYRNLSQHAFDNSSDISHSAFSDNGVFI